MNHLASPTHSRCDEDPLGVHSEEYGGSLPLLADQVLRGHFQIVEEDFGRRVIIIVRMGQIKRPRPIASRMSTIRTERPSVRFAALRDWHDACEKQHEVRVLPPDWSRSSAGAMKVIAFAARGGLEEDVSIAARGFRDAKACSRRRPARSQEGGDASGPRSRAAGPSPLCTSGRDRNLRATARWFLQHRGRCRRGQTCPAMFFGDQDGERQPASVSAPTNSLG